MVGVILNEKQLFKTSVGPAFAGGLSVIAAILSRLLPDSTSIEMLKTQQEIERQQFPSLGRLAPEAAQPVQGGHQGQLDAQPEDKHQQQQEEAKRDNKELELQENERRI